jgi:hypothetical protein
MKIRLTLVVATAAVAGGAASAVAAASDLTCNGTYTRMTLGNVTVPADAVCRLDSDALNGNITVSGQLYASSLDVSGNLSSQGGKVVQIDSSTIGGNVNVANLHDGPASQDSLSVEINDIGGNLVAQSNTSPTGDMLVSTNTVHGNEVEVFNTVSGDLAIVAETVSGNMAVFRNAGVGAKEVDANSVGNILLCLGNQAPFEAHGNAARVIVGNC